MIEFDKNQTRRYFDAKVTPSYEKGPLFLLLVCNGAIASFCVTRSMLLDPLSKYSSKWAFVFLPQAGVGLSLQESKENLWERQEPVGGAVVLRDARAGWM